MRGFLTLSDILLGVLAVVVIAGVVAIGTVFFINTVGSVFGYHAAFVEGYSMCRASSPGYDYTPLGDYTCAYSPGDVLITKYSWPPEVNSIACVNTRDVGVVCHRVYSSSDDRACFIGDNARARWTLCFGPSQYVGTVVARLPRAFGIPGIAFVVARDSVLSYIASINNGRYPSI